MTELKVGDSFPEDVVFRWIPYTEEKSSIKVTGTPQDYEASKEWADKKVVLFAVPGAFTGTCSTKHLPPYIEHIADFRAKGVDVIACIAYNDAHVMSAWSKAHDVKNDDILFLSDHHTAFSKRIGWTRDERTARYAMILDHGKIAYAAKEPAKEIVVSGAEAVLSKL